MPILIPNLFKKNIFEITHEDLKELKVKGVILDVDNTLTTHSSPIPKEGIEQWIANIRKQGYKLIISSNNTKKRVSKFAALLGLEYVSMSCKPFPFGLKRACRTMGLNMNETVIIGDQLFTDILGGNLVGLKTILVEPFELETNKLMRYKRVLEKNFVKKMKK
jgi:HAD superfamily phosphatase (TIGR01668 family)